MKNYHHTSGLMTRDGVGHDDWWMDGWCRTPCGWMVSDMVDGVGNDDCWAIMFDSPAISRKGENQKRCPGDQSSRRTTVAMVREMQRHLYRPFTCCRTGEFEK